jgi:peptidoglycan/xylan/chitin deacetylase (PgdA/CDA1 family)
MTAAAVRQSRKQRTLSGLAAVAVVTASLYGLAQITSPTKATAQPVARNLPPCPVLSETVPADFHGGAVEPTRGLARGIITVAFDDGWQTVYDNALPILVAHHIPSTQYIISGAMQGDPEYVSAEEVANYVRSGQEIGSHTVTHPHLGDIPADQARQELDLSRGQLTAVTAPAGQPMVCDFAPPYGEPTKPTSAMNTYSSARGSQDIGYNGAGTNPYQIKVQDVDATTTPADVQSWIDAAVANNWWMVLVYHSITPTATTDLAHGRPYGTMPADFETEMTAVTKSGLVPLTMSAALAEVIPQK